MTKSAVAVVVLLLLVLYHKELELASVDPSYALAIGAGVARLYASYDASVSSGTAMVLICTLAFVVVWLAGRRWG